MPAGDDELRAALAALAAADAPGLVAEARERARERARAILADTLVDAMLDAARRELEPVAAPVPVADVAPAQPEVEVGVGWYVYCVTGAEEPLEAGLAGVDPAHEVTAVREGQLAAVVSRVSLAEFDEAALRERLGDIEWVERVARRHQDVIEAMRARGTVIPLRLCSVYRRQEGVRGMLGERAAVLAEALAELEGKAEWGVQAFAAAAPPPREVAAGPGEGAAYLNRRRHEQEERLREDARLEQAAGAIHTRLGALCSAERVLVPQRAEASGRQGEMILNGAYLVAEEATAAFEAELEAIRLEHRELGLELVRTGPWPPYNFVPPVLGAAA